MSLKNDLAAVLANSEWLPSHWDRVRGTVDFVHIERRSHAELTFLADEYLQPLKLPTMQAPLSELKLSSKAPTPHYIFHSAFCVSTLLTCALDLPGIAVGLKEPQILNDLADGLRAGSLSRDVLGIVMHLLARPFGPGEKVIIKPSNVASVLASPLMELDDGSRAIFLYAPLPRFLRSIADKGLWGRRWTRRLFPLVSGDTKLDFGFSAAEQFELTDLQVSALAWLMQHAQGAALVTRFPGRVRTLDSETFLARRAETLAAAGQHFGLALLEQKSREIANGPVFSTHSKEIGRSFDPEEPLKPKVSVPILDEEIEMVTTWIHSVADHAGLSIDLSAEAGLLSD